MDASCGVLSFWGWLVVAVPSHKFTSLPSTNRTKPISCVNSCPERGLAASEPTPTRVAGKILPTNCKSPAQIRERLEGTLKRLGVDSIALYQVHWPLEPADVAPTFAELAVLQKEGKIAHIGVSNFGVKQMTEAMACV
jgi:aryl-alcohol dehydrogenase-like predicted oxidoreductase